METVTTWTVGNGDNIKLPPCSSLLPTCCTVVYHQRTNCNSELSANRENQKIVTSLGRKVLANTG